MDADVKKIKKLAKMMRQEGVLLYKTPEIELQLSPVAVFHVEQSAVEVPHIAVPDEKEMSPYTKDEVMLWSAPGYVTEEEVN